MVREKGGAILTTERIFECQRLCILVGYKSLLILNGSDVNMKMHLKIMEKVLIVQE